MVISYDSAGKKSIYHKDWLGYTLERIDDFGNKSVNDSSFSSFCYCQGAFNKSKSSKSTVALVSTWDDTSPLTPYCHAEKACLRTLLIIAGMIGMIPMKVSSYIYIFLQWLFPISDSTTKLFAPYQRRRWWRI